MNNLYKTFILISFISVICLGTYSVKLKHQINKNQAEIRKLSLKINLERTMTMENKTRLEKHDQRITKLNDDYINRRKFEIHANYIKYKKTITRLIDKKLPELVNEKPRDQGRWILSKIEFLNPVLAYVEYEDGHTLYASFIQITKNKKGYNLKAIY